MKIGILGDVHGNLDALTTVVDALKSERVDVWIQVGDIVGYGPEPSECIEVIRDLGCVTCLGNHDAAVLGRLDTSYFNQYARAAIQWTAPKLTPSDYEFLNALELVSKRAEFTVAHGTLHMPEQFGYVVSAVDALESLKHQETRLCFVGHSHVPAIYLRRDEHPSDIHVVPHAEAEISYRGFDRLLMNVGSVGQPRDEDPRAAYGFVDTDLEVASIRRVAYNIASVQAKIREAGLPEVLANRLSLGV